MKRTDSFLEDTDRYKFDCEECTYEAGWAQIDTTQDAWYYGNWINPTKREVVIFAEGDLSRIQFDDDQEMVAWVQRFKDHGGLGFLGIDPGFDPTFRDVLSLHGLAAFLH